RELKAHIETSKVRFEAWSKKSVHLNDQKVALQERVELTKRSISDNEKRWRQLDMELTNKLHECSYASLEDIIYILEHTFHDDTEKNAVKKTIADYHQQLYAAKVQAAKVKGIIGDRLFEEEKFN